jgi:hypothetical protein
MAVLRVRHDACPFVRAGETAEAGLQTLKGGELALPQKAGARGTLTGGGGGLCGPLDM